MKHTPLSPVQSDDDKFGSYIAEVNITETDDPFTEVATPISIKGLPSAKGQVHALTTNEDEGERK